MNKLIETIRTPQDSVNDDTVMILQINVKNGDKISENTLLVEIETSKANIEIHSEKAGYVKCLCQEGQEVLIGEKLFEIYSKTLIIDRNLVNKENIKTIDNNNNHVTPFDTKFSKTADSLISDKKINKEVFKTFDFVSSFEVKNYINENKPIERKKDTKKEPLIIDVKSINEEKILGKKKLNEIKYLSDVNSSGLVSRLTIFVKSSLEKITESQNFISSTPAPLITFEVSRLLLKYPNLNSFYHSKKIISHNDINIGIAFDNGINGLKVASIYNADSLDLNSIEENVSELSIKYNENKFSIKDISSSSFTITDLFASGISNFHPLVNINNSAILGICGLNNGGFNIELSFDHRVSSGLEVSSFLKDLKSRLETHYDVETKGIFSCKNDLSKCSKCFRNIDDNLDGKVKFLKNIDLNENNLICSLCLLGW